MKLQKYLVYPLLYMICFVYSPDLFGQRTHEFSAGIGTTYYYGDLTDKFNNSLIRPAASITYAKYLMPVLKIRTGFSYGEVGAADAQAIDVGRKVRNLHFRSKVFEAHAALVVELFRDKNFGNSWRDEVFFTPYFFAGVGLFHFNPQARYEGVWRNLQPLGTEGQYIGGAKVYSTIQFSAPFGAGLSLRLTDYTGISLEVGYRMTGTDYLDDVSTIYPDFDALKASGGDLAVELSERSPDGIFNPGDRRGNPGSKDSYFFVMFTVNYYLSRYASRN
ncbi:MAG: DUF6089 family protein [Bacteroidota bacterium]